MLIGALGCNRALGIIDAVLYLMGCLVEKGKDFNLHAVRKATDATQAHRLIADALPSVVASVLSRLNWKRCISGSQLPEPAQRAHPQDDWLGATGVFLLVFLSTFPAGSFIFRQNAGPALRGSNGIAITMLFITGYAFGCITGRHLGCLAFHGRSRGRSSGRPYLGG